MPKDIRSHYNTRRISFSLKTKYKVEAYNSSLSISKNLENHWSYLRLKSDHLQINRFISEKSQIPISISSAQDDVKFSDAVNIYIETKGRDRPKTFRKSVERAYKYLLNVTDDKYINLYTRKDAINLRDFLVTRGLSGSSVVRVFNTIKAIYNFIINEKGINSSNPFTGLYIDRVRGVTTRKSFSIDDLRLIQRKCRSMPDELRMIVLLVSDTGLRLSEALGLEHNDLHVKNEIIPYVTIQNHPWRRLKTKGSSRKIPLVGNSLWAAKEVTKFVKNRFVFPRYNKNNYTNSNSASAALNKWIKSEGFKEHSMHSFRHSLRDRLRSVECPIEIADQIGGWAFKSVGQGYGNGYCLKILAKWMNSITKE